jgi:ATP-independent RNA helicase DbpA
MKSTANEICKHLQDLGAIVDTLHGDLDQREREKVMTTFANKSTRILVATDIAARGLDIENLDLVINYDLPHDSETYLHRIGRTGRAGAKGVAITIVNPRDTVELVPLEEITGEKFERPTLGFKNQYGLVPELKIPLMNTLLISAGRKDKLRAGDILGALTKYAGLKSDNIGKIDIKDNHAYVAISFAFAQQAFEHLKAGRIKGKRYPVRLLK